MSAISTANMDLETARTALDAVVASATQSDVACAVAITDLGGHIVAAARMDGAPFIALDAAKGKAILAASFNVPSKDLLEGLAGDPLALPALRAMPDVTVLPGGFPVIRASVTVGGLGVSGGHHSQDHEIGLSALLGAGLAGDGTGAA